MTEEHFFTGVDRWATDGLRMADLQKACFDLREVPDHTQYPWGPQPLEAAS